MPASTRGIDFIAHSDQGGRPDGVQVMVHRGYAYVGHTFSGGFSIVDVRDPKNPNAAGFVAAPPNTRSLHLQTHDDLLLAINAQDPLSSNGSQPAPNFAAGLRVFDISRPGQPREIGFHPAALNHS